MEARPPPASAARNPCAARCTPISRRSFACAGSSVTSPTTTRTAWRTASGIVGAGVDWYPTDRTSITATVEDRVFGRGYDLGLNHRMRRAVFFLGAGPEDVSSLAQSLGTVVLADRDCFARVREIADPIEREQALIECLSLGVLRRAPTPPTSSAPFRGGFSLLGVRNTFSLSAQPQRSQPNRLDHRPASGRRPARHRAGAHHHGHAGLESHAQRDELAVRHARALGFRGRGRCRPGARRLTGTVGVDRTLGPRTRAGLRYQYEKTEGDRDYATNSVTATLGMRF